MSESTKNQVAEETRQERQARYSREYLDLEDPLSELRAFTLLMVFAFESLFNTEQAQRDDEAHTVTFTVRQDQLWALQFAMDEVNSRTRKVFGVFTGDVG